VSRSVLDDAIKSLPGSVLLGSEAFAIAESVDMETSRLTNLVLPEDLQAKVQIRDTTVLVSMDRAKEQRRLDGLLMADQSSKLGPTEAQPVVIASGDDVQGISKFVELPKSRFFGTFRLDSVTYARDFTSLNREILDRIADSDVELEVIVEIQAKKPGGFDPSVQRTVSENAKALGFSESSFESD